MTGRNPIREPKSYNGISKTVWCLLFYASLHGALNSNHEGL